MNYPESTPLTEILGRGVWGSRDAPPPTIEEVKLIVENNPGVAQQYVLYESDFGDVPISPLDVALENYQIDAEIVEFLIEQCPQSVRQANYRNRKCHGPPFHVHCADRCTDRDLGECGLPLHKACENGCSLAVLKTLVKHYADATSKKGRYGQLPLTCLLWGLWCQCRPCTTLKLERVKYILDQYPDAVREGDCDGDDMLPVSIAICCGRHDCPEVHEIVKLLIEAFPDCIWQRREVSWVDPYPLPAHEACESHLSVETIEYLVDLYPKVLQLEDGSGYIPLEIACSGRHPCNIEVVDMLMRKTPGAFVNPKRLLVAHLSDERYGKECRFIYLQLIQYLVERFPRLAASTTGPDGELPLHIASRRYGRSPLDSCSNSVYQRYALRKDAHLADAPDALEAVIKANPQALLVLSKDNRLPLEDLKRSKYFLLGAQKMVEEYMKKTLYGMCDDGLQEHIHLPEDIFGVVVTYLVGDTPGVAGHKTLDDIKKEIWNNGF